VELEQKVGEAKAYRTGVEGLDDAANILQDLSQLNNELNVLYGDSTQRGRANIFRPKLVNLANEQF
jgi:hypothetical protein